MGVYVFVGGEDSSGGKRGYHEVWDIFWLFTIFMENNWRCSLMAFNSMGFLGFLNLKAYYPMAKSSLHNFICYSIYSIFTWWKFYVIFCCQTGLKRGIDGVVADLSPNLLPLNGKVLYPLTCVCIYLGIFYIHDEWGYNYMFDGIPFHLSSCFFSSLMQLDVLTLGK